MRKLTPTRSTILTDGVWPSHAVCNTVVACDIAIYFCLWAIMIRTVFISQWGAEKHCYFGWVKGGGGS